MLYHGSGGVGMTSTELQPSLNWLPMRRASNVLLPAGITRVSMVSSYIGDFSNEISREAIQARAYLCLYGYLVDPDEARVNDGDITVANLVWRHFVALHNSNRAIRYCAHDLSEEGENDTLIASALTQPLRLQGYIEDKSSLLSIAQTGTDELLAIAVRTQAAFEALSGSWQTIRQIFRQKGEERKERTSHQSARSASIAAAGWRAAYEDLCLELASESTSADHKRTTHQDTREATGLQRQQKDILDAWGNEEQVPRQYTLMGDAGSNSLLLGSHMVRVWLEKAQGNTAYVFVPPYCFKDEVDKAVRAVAQMSKGDPGLVVEYYDAVQPSNIEGMVWLMQVDYAQMLSQPYLEFYKKHPPMRLLVSHEPSGQWIDPPAGMMQLLRHNFPAPLSWDVVPATEKEGHQRFKDLRHTKWYDSLVTLLNRHHPVSDHYLVCMYLSIIASEAMSHQELPEEFWTTGKVGQYMKTIRNRQRKGMDVEHLLEELREHPEDFRGRFSHIMFELVRNGVLRVPDYTEIPDLRQRSQQFAADIVPIAIDRLTEEGLMGP